MAVSTGAWAFASTLLPINRLNITSSINGRSKQNPVTVSRTRRSALSTENIAMTSSESENWRFETKSGEMVEKREEMEKKREETERKIGRKVAMEREDLKRLSLKDYFENSKELFRSDGGPPRWFSPLECGAQEKNSPLFLYLSGLGGNGFGLVLHHQKLGKIFDIWCLHIPVKDRTPFTDLVKMVERTVRSENNRSPNRPVYLVGESLGGCLALAVAARNPDIDLILILANPATSFSKSQLQPLIPLLEIMPDQLHLSLPRMSSIMTGDPMKMVMATVATVFPLQEQVEELTEDLAAMASYFSVLADDLSKETLLWKLQMLKSASAFANSRLHAVKAQTLLLCSGGDQLLPSQEEGERLECALPKCEIRKFRDSGHFLFLEDGISLVTIIKGAGFYRRAKYLDYVSDYMPATPTEVKHAEESFRWLTGVASPVLLSTLESGEIVRSLSGIPSEGPVLFVGYHMLFGLELAPMVLRLLNERNILMRGMAHPMMFGKLRRGKLPAASEFDLFRLMGAVPVSAKNLYNLLSAKSHVLLYPGGMREALHRKGEEYKLFWPQQAEFIRMAAKFGAKIIPFGVVGEDDFAEIFFDYDDQMKIPIIKADIENLTNEVVQLRTDADGEVANQDVHAPWIRPKLPGRFYYFFGKPIETEGRKQELLSKEKSHELYIKVQSEVKKCLSYLKEKREKDPYRNILSRVAYQATHGFTEEIPTFEP